MNYYVRQLKTLIYRRLNGIELSYTLREGLSLDLKDNSEMSEQARGENFDVVGKFGREFPVELKRENTLGMTGMHVGGPVIEKISIVYYKNQFSTY